MHKRSFETEGILPAGTAGVSSNRLDEHQSEKAKFSQSLEICNAQIWSVEVTGLAFVVRLRGQKRTPAKSVVKGLVHLVVLGLVAPAEALLS